jgi:hypothetical protein
LVPSVGTLAALWFLLFWFKPSQLDERTLHTGWLFRMPAILGRVPQFRAQARQNVESELIGLLTLFHV